MSLDQIILGGIALAALVIAVSQGSLFLDRLRARRRLAAILAEGKR